jgi:hypothetical protein
MGVGIHPKGRDFLASRAQVTTGFGWYVRTAGWKPVEKIDSLLHGRITGRAENSPSLLQHPHKERAHA